MEGEPQRSPAPPHALKGAECPCICSSVKCPDLITCVKLLKLSLVFFLLPIFLFVLFDHLVHCSHSQVSRFSTGMSSSCCTPFFWCFLLFFFSSFLLGPVTYGWGHPPDRLRASRVPQAVEETYPSPLQGSTAGASGPRASVPGCPMAPQGASGRCQAETPSLSCTIWGNSSLHLQLGLPAEEEALSSTLYVVLQVSAWYFGLK